MSNFTAALNSTAAAEYIAARYAAESGDIRREVERAAREHVAAYDPDLLNRGIDVINSIVETGANMAAERVLNRSIVYIERPRVSGISRDYCNPVEPALKWREGELKISRHNRKINALSDYTGLKTAALDIRAGHSCPAADICRGQIEGGHIVDGPRARVRCYAVKLEAAYPNVYAAHLYNETLLRDAVKSGDAAAVIARGLKGLNILRLHSSGDIFSLQYGEAIAAAAREVPNVLIFGYTKFAPALTRIEWPDNVKLQYSIGGVYDSKINPAITPSNFIIMPDDITYSTGGLKRAIVSHNGQFYNIPVQVNAFDDFNFIRAGVTFGITLH